MIANDLPYIRQAFHEVLVDLDIQPRTIAGKLTPNIFEIVTQLCEPDPAELGEPIWS